MPQIFELFGYAIAAQSETITQGRHLAQCPFGGGACTGGDSRRLPMVTFPKRSELAAYFEESHLKQTPAGVCSIQLTEGEAPWVVCPRRLLSPGADEDAPPPPASPVAAKLLAWFGYAPGTRLGVWHKVRVPVPDSAAGVAYTFEYVIMPVANVPLRQLYETLGGEHEDVDKRLRQGGYGFAVRHKEVCALDYPVGQPNFIEVLPVGVAGGNKDERSHIALAFEDALLGKPHTAPEVLPAPTLERLLAELLAKSQAALACGGQLVWVAQDKLLDQISTNTALNLAQQRADRLAEVNLLSVAYDDLLTTPEAGPIELTRLQLFAGPVAAPSASFQDIARARALPDQNAFMTSLLSKKKLRHWTVG